MNTAFSPNISINSGVSFFFVQPSVQFKSFTQTVASGAKPSGVLMLKNLFYLSAEIKQLFFYTTRTNFIVVRFINTSTLLTAWHNIPGIHLWLQLIAMTAPCVFISLFLFFTRSVSVCVCMCLIWNIRSPLLFCILKTLYVWCESYQVKVNEDRRRNIHGK